MVFTTMGNWYLRAHCRMAGAERVFRIDRIQSIDISEEIRSPLPTSEPVAEIGYTPGAEDVQATIQLDEYARWVPANYPVETVADDADGLIVRFSASDASVIARLLLRLGNTAELVDGSRGPDRLSEMSRAFSLDMACA